MVTAALLALVACSDDDGGGSTSDDEPSASEPAASPTEAGKADTQEVKAVIRAYDEALAGFVIARAMTPELEAVTTERWAEQLLTTYDDNVFSNGLELVGQWRTTVRSVQVAGDTAEATACSDGTEVYVVEEGSGTDGATDQGRQTARISLVREDDGWQVDGNVTGEGKC